MTCRYHQGKDPRCAECAVARVWDVYYDWYDVDESDSELLIEIYKALSGPTKKPKRKEKTNNNE